LQAWNERTLKEKTIGPMTKAKGYHLVCKRLYNNSTAFTRRQKTIEQRIDFFKRVSRWELIHQRM
jgi:glycerol-3-phosphate dehydrogenase